MAESVSLQFSYQRADFAAAVFANYGTRRRVMIDAALAVLLIALGLWLRREPDFWGWMGALFIGVGAVFLAMLAAMRVFAPAIALRRDPKFAGQYRLEFSDAGIHFETSGIDSRLQWEFYSRALAARDCWLLYHGRAYTLVPMRVFADDTERARFDALATAHIAKIERR